MLLLLGHGYEMLSYSRSVRSQMLESLVGIKLPDGYAFILYYVVLALLFSFTLWIEKYLATKLGERFALTVRAWVFERHLLIPAIQFEENGFGRHLTRYGSELTGLQRLITLGGCRFISDSILVTGLLSAVYRSHLYSGVVLTIVITIGAIVLWVGQRKPAEKVRFKRSKQTRLLNFVVRRFTEISNIQREGLQRKEQIRFDKKNRELYDAAIQYHRLATSTAAIAESLSYFALIAVLGIAVSNPHPPPLSVMVLMLALFPALRRLLKLPAVWQLGMLSLRRLDSLDVGVKGHSVSL